MTKKSSTPRRPEPPRGLSPAKPVKRPRGPSPAKTAATRQALAAAALATFLEQGYAATRMGDVAARAGLAKGTIYLHFADKAALFEEVLHEAMRQGHRGRPGLRRPRPDESTGDFLRRAMLPLLRELQASGRFGVLRLIAAEGPRLPELAAVYRKAVISPVLRLVRIYAARAARRGELRSGALSAHPMLLVAPVVLTALWNNLYGQTDALDIATVFEAYLDLLFGGRTPSCRREG